MSLPIRISRSKYVFVNLIIAVVLTACGQTNEPLKTNYTGTYQLDRGSGYCVLKVLQQETPRLELELFCIKGAPSYNSGYLMKSLIFEDGFAEFVSDGYGNGCYLTFSFEEDGVLVDYVDSRINCGFGGSVYANGQYAIVDNETPILGCMRLDDPCGLAPEP